MQECRVNMQHVLAQLALHSAGLLEATLQRLQGVEGRIPREALRMKLKKERVDVLNSDERVAAMLEEQPHQKRGRLAESNPLNEQFRIFKLQSGSKYKEACAAARIDANTMNLFDTGKNRPLFFKCVLTLVPAGMCWC
jgi:hypothetical protein